MMLPKKTLSGFTVTFFHDCSNCNQCENCAFSQRLKVKKKATHRKYAYRSRNNTSVKNGKNSTDERKYPEVVDLTLQNTWQKHVLCQERNLPILCIRRVVIENTPKHHINDVVQPKQQCEFYPSKSHVKIGKGVVKRKKFTRKKSTKQCSVCEVQSSPCDCKEDKRHKKYIVRSAPSSVSKQSTVMIKTVPSNKKFTYKDGILEDQTGSSLLKSQKVQKSSSPKSSDGEKKPKKGTLKRKRWVINKLKQSNENYEDDIFEEHKFHSFTNLLEDDSESSDKYNNMKTPTRSFSLSPKHGTQSPEYRDCYSPTELSSVRKEAEEYHFRRDKRRKMMLSVEKKESPGPCVADVKEETDVTKTLEEVCKILTMTTPKNENENECDSDELEDYYFSDVSEA